MQHNLIYDPSGFDGPASTMPMRMAVITILVSSWVLLMAYSGSLTSFQTVFKLKMPFSNLDTLYSTTKFKIGSIEGSVY